MPFNPTPRITSGFNGPVGFSEPRIRQQKGLSAMALAHAHPLLSSMWSHSHYIGKTYK